MPPIKLSPDIWPRFQAFGGGQGEPISHHFAPWAPPPDRDWILCAGCGALLRISPWFVSGIFCGNQSQNFLSPPPHPHTSPTCRPTPSSERVALVAVLLEGGGLLGVLWLWEAASQGVGLDALWGPFWLGEEQRSSASPA